VVLSWLVNVGWSVILASYQLLQSFSTAARLVKVHLEFCTSRGQTKWFFKGV